MDARAVVDDGITPMEGLFNVEMARAATGLPAGRASELANRLLEKYETQIETAPRGERYTACYDLRTRKPSEAYTRLYDEVKDELAQMGLPF